MNILENEDLAWERFEKAITGEDVVACYDMSLKEFEHSGVHDLFKAMSKFIAASRQGMELDRMKVLLETRVKEVKDNCKGWAEVAVKAKDEAKELQNPVEELRADIVEKDTRLDHLQKRNDELSSLLNKAKEDAVVEFKASKQFTDLLDTNYAVALRIFTGTPWKTSLKLTLAPLSSILVLPQALFSKRALKTLTLKMMPTLSLPKTSLTLESTTHSEDKICLDFPLFSFSSFFMRFIV